MTSRRWLKQVATHASAACTGGIATFLVMSYTDTLKNRNDREPEVLSQELSTATTTDDERCGENETKLIAPRLPLYTFRPNPKMEIVFDTRTRNPLYVLERLPSNNADTGDNNEHDVSASRNFRFTEESSLPVEFRSRNSHYKHSGYDRGHLAAVANFSSSKEKADTYTLCNASPQHPHMNRTTWAHLESWCRKVASNAMETQETWVVTGPLWIPSKCLAQKEFQYQHIGIGLPPHLVSVPTHFFKVLVVVQREQIVKFAAFVVPNVQKDKKRRFLHDYLVRWSDLEAVTGMHLFPKWTRQTNWKDQADFLTDSVRNRDHNNNPFLLSDGALQISKHKMKGAKGKVKKESSEPFNLQHLCSSGKCV